MKIITTEANQTIYDIAVQYYGSVEAVGELLRLNENVLRNDPTALIAQGIDTISDKAFYMDVALDIGLILAVDDKSRLVQQNIVRELKTPQTKYD